MSSRNDTYAVLVLLAELRRTLHPFDPGDDGGGYGVDPGVPPPLPPTGAPGALADQGAPVALTPQEWSARLRGGAAPGGPTLHAATASRAPEKASPAPSTRPSTRGPVSGPVPGTPPAAGPGHRPAVALEPHDGRGRPTGPRPPASAAGRPDAPTPDGARSPGPVAAPDRPSPSSATPAVAARTQPERHRADAGDAPAGTTAGGSTAHRLPPDAGRRSAAGARRGRPRDADRRTRRARFPAGRPVLGPLGPTRSAGNRPARSRPSADAGRFGDRFAELRGGVRPAGDPHPERPILTVAAPPLRREPPAGRTADRTPDPTGLPETAEPELGRRRRRLPAATSGGVRVGRSAIALDPVRAVKLRRAVATGFLDRALRRGP